MILFFYLHFTWLCASWKLQRIFEKQSFLKHESWFPSEVSRITSANYPWNDAFSGITKFDYYVVTVNQFRFRHTTHLKMTIWTSFLYKIPCSWQKNDTKWSKNGHLWVISFQNFFFQNWKKICKPKKVFHVIAFDLTRI